MALIKPNRRAVEAVFVFLEDHMSKPNAQRFRKLQHSEFGLTNKEWIALPSLMASYEAMGVAVQRKDGFKKEVYRLIAIEANATSRQMWQAAVNRHHRLPEEYKDKEKVCSQIRTSINAAAEEIKRTPIYRALCSRHQNPNWFDLDWLTERCEESDGCCACGCGCCQKDRDIIYRMWKGHCTPACHCCLKHVRIKRPIGLLENPRKLPYSLAPSDDDIFRRQIIDVLFWDP